MIFPDFLVNCWAFSFWILLFIFSDFSFKSWSFLILWLIAWRSVGFKGSSSESPSGIAACNDVDDSWQWRSYWRLPSDFHDNEHEEETGYDDDDYDSVHADDIDGDDTNDCGDKEYDGSSKMYVVVPAKKRKMMMMMNKKWMMA